MVSEHADSANDDNEYHGNENVHPASDDIPYGLVSFMLPSRFFYLLLFFLRSR